ncbi:MAG: lamin tail domain-containing protein, partial [Phaeodactylibacter sp.]|nr:lamin tail domain-containing protein [Phaeodactylibacter sp.]
MKRTLHVGNILRDACSLLKALRLPFIALILPLAQVLALPGLDSGGPEIPSITGSTSVVSPGDIIFNEIMQNPNAVSDSDGEWFELYNTTSASIDINGWRIADAGSDMHLIDNGGPLEIPSGGYLVLGINADPATNGGVAVDYAYGSGLTLGNGDDELILFTPDSVEVDRVEWDGGPLFPDPTGASMALQAVGDDNNDGANWCVSTAAYGDGDLGTPGAANDCLAPTTVTLLVTEIFSGQAGTDLTADWFEI